MVRKARSTVALALALSFCAFAAEAQEAPAASAAGSTGAASAAAPEAGAPALPAASPGAAASAGAQAATDAQAQVEPAPARKPGFFGWLASPEVVRPEMGTIFGINLDTYAGTSPDPANEPSSTPFYFPPSLGIGVRYRFGASGFGFEPDLSLWMYGFHLTKDGRAVPAEYSNGPYRDAAVFGAIVDLPLMFGFGLGTRSRLSFGLGPAFNLRGGLAAAPDVDPAAVAAINAWFWAKGRWFQPITLLRYEYRVDRRNAIALTLSVRWPVYNAWAGESSIGGLDQTMIALGIGLSRSPR